MKKIALLFALAALATSVGCLSNAAQACLKQGECAEEADPAKFCEEAQADCDGNEACAKAGVDCAAEQDALAACIVANGTCDEIGDLKFFGVEAAGADGACETQATANGECAIASAE